MDLLKKFVLWNYSRETSVYVIFCLLIVAFIFLTPKEWFNRKDSFATQTSRLIVKAKDFSPDRNELEKRVKEETGNPNAEIINLNERADASGEIFYEIEIR